MGIIQRQSIKRTIAAYVGVGLGAVSTMFIYPLDYDIYGFGQFLLSLALVLAPLASIGIRTLSVRFFPHFRDEANGHNGFMTFLVVTSLISLTVFWILVFLFQEHIYALLGRLGFDVDVYRDNILSIAILTFLFVFIDLFINYTSNFRRVVVPEIFYSLISKIGTPLLVLLFFFSYIGLLGFKIGLIATYALILLAVLGYLYWLKQLRFTAMQPKLRAPEMRRQMGSYAIYGMLTVLGSHLAFKIDSIMVTSLLSEFDNGVNHTAQFVTNTMLIPYASVGYIAAPIIAENWKTNNLTEIQAIYRKASLNLLIIGSILLGGIVLTIDYVFQLSGSYDNLALSVPVIVWLGAAKLSDMAFGVNNQIIAYSNYYQFNLYSVLVLAGINIYLNFLLIPEYGITGAAMATAISLGVFNVIKFLFVWLRFGLQPFTYRTLLVMGLVGFAFTVAYWLPELSHPLFNVLLRGGVFVVLAALPLFVLRVSPDMNDLVIKYLPFLGRKSAE